MVWRERTAPHRVEIHRQRGAFGKARERGTGIAPPNLAASNYRRAFGILQERCGALYRCRIAARRGRGAIVFGNFDFGVFRDAEQNVDGDFKKRRTESPGEHLAERNREKLRDAARVQHRARPFSDGRCERDAVQFLERTHLELIARRLPADDEHRAVRLKRVRNAGHRIGHANAGGHDRNAGAACQTRVRVRRVRRGLLVPQIDNANALVDQAVVDRHDVPAAQREHRVDFFALEHLRDEMSSIQHVGS